MKAPWAAGVWLALAMACESAPSEPLAPVPRAPAAKQQLASPPPAPPPALPRTGECHARSERGEVRSGATLRAQERLVLEAGEACELLFPDGAVVTLTGPGRARVTQGAGLAIRQGLAQLDLAPSALTPSSGFALALPGGRLQLVHGARLVLRVHEGADSELLVVSGQASLEPVGGGRVASTLRTGDGAVLTASGDVTKSAAGPRTVESALALLHARPARAGDPAPAFLALTQLVAQLSMQVEADQKRTSELAREHERRVAQGDPTAMKLQAELALHAAQAFRTTQRLRSHAAALESWLVDRDGAGAAAAELLTRAALLARP